MRYKSEAGTTLDRINCDVGVVNEIFMDNSPNHIGYNTERQRVSRLTRMDVHTTKIHSPLQNNSESVMNIIKIKLN